METRDKKRRARSARPASGKVAARTAPKRRPAPAKAAQERMASEVVYTQAKPFNRTRFLLRLATVVAVVLALLFGMSIFFKVDENKITVSGAEKYTPWEIRQASGIQDGENLLTISDARVSGNIIANLPYVKSVRVGIKLPDTVNIEIVELDVVYAMEAGDGSWWLISADGNVIEQTNGAEAGGYTQILGVKLDSPVVGQSAKALEEAEPEQTDASKTTDASEASSESAEPSEPSEPSAPAQIPVTVLAKERLAIALSILQNLEANGILGEVVSVDVTETGAIELWYEQRYQVNLGDATRLDYKIQSMKKAIDQMSEYQSGILDVSFTTWPDEVGYTRFS